MQIKVYKENKLVATYDEKTKEIDTDIPALRKLVTDGAETLRPDGPGHARKRVIVSPGHVNYFFAFVDAVEDLGYDVAKDVEAEWVRRKR